MFHKLITVVAWAIFAFIVYATISPIQDRPTFPISSSFEHLAAFAVRAGPGNLHRAISGVSA
jgi:hypothetical protein